MITANIAPPITPVDKTSLYDSLAAVGFGRGIREAFTTFANVKKQQQSDIEYTNHKNNINQLVTKAKERFVAKKGTAWTEEDYDAVNDTVKDIALSGAPSELWKPTAQILLDLNEDNAKRYNLKASKKGTVSIGQQETVPEMWGKGTGGILPFTAYLEDGSPVVFNNDSLKAGSQFMDMSEFSDRPYADFPTLTKYKADGTPRALYKVNDDGTRTPAYLKEDLVGWFAPVDKASIDNEKREKTRFKYFEKREQVKLDNTYDVLGVKDRLQKDKEKRDAEEKDPSITADMKILSSLRDKVYLKLKRYADKMIGEDDTENVAKLMKDIENDIDNNVHGEVYAKLVADNNDKTYDEAVGLIKAERLVHQKYIKYYKNKKGVKPNPTPVPNPANGKKATGINDQMQNNFNNFLQNAEKEYQSKKKESTAPQG
jgi:hypothetical protein